MKSNQILRAISSKNRFTFPYNSIFIEEFFGAITLYCAILRILNAESFLGRKITIQSMTILHEPRKLTFFQIVLFR